MLAAGESGAKLNELMSRRYPVVEAKSYKTRDQVKSELARAIREGELVAVGEDGRKLNEIYPDRYHAAHHAAVATNVDTSAKDPQF
jgi:hypothetical protein